MHCILYHYTVNALHYIAFLTHSEVRQFNVFHHILSCMYGILLKSTCKTKIDSKRNPSALKDFYLGLTPSRTFLFLRSWETFTFFLLFLCTGFYQFCCDGVHCSDCPMELNISTLQQNVSLNSALNLTCIKTPFTATFKTDKQPGKFAVKVSFLGSVGRRYFDIFFGF